MVSKSFPAERVADEAKVYSQPEPRRTSSRSTQNSIRMLAVVIPCYRVSAHILKVIERIPADVSKIYVIDDACPEKSGLHVEQNCKDPRVFVLYHPVNLGVGGAVISGYRQALKDGADVVLKIDGDGQMDPALIPRFVRPLIAGKADYTKGNRFYNLESLTGMPSTRLFGNASLSFVNKIVSGYWHVMDPTNGFTAISRFCLERLPLQKIDRRYFFENDMLFRLGTLRAVVQDIPMDSVYGTEQSNLRIGRILFDFPIKYFTRFVKRIFYTYYLRDFSVGSIALLFGSILSIFGMTVGTVSWINNSAAGTFASTGTVMLAALPILVGVQLLLVALVLDVLNAPREPLSGNTDANSESAI